MRKSEFLDTLARQTKNARLVEYYDELIADRMQEGEREEDIIAGFDIKQIIRLAEIEASQSKNKVIEETTYKKVIEREYEPGEANGPPLADAYVSHRSGADKTIPANRSGQNYTAKVITYLVLALTAFAGVVVCLILTAYQIGEIFEYTDMSDRVEHGVYAVVSGIGILVFLIVGIVFLVKHSKYSKLNKQN